MTKEAILSRLQNLEEVEYQTTRKEIAKEFGTGVNFIDKLYKEVNQKELPTSGSVLAFDDVIPIGEGVCGLKLLNDLRDSINKFVILPHGGAETIALWVLFTWCHDSFGISPILALQSPQKGSGKTTTLDWIQRVVPRPLPTSHATKAAIFRSIEQWHPCLLLDEADSFMRNSEDLRGLLDSGHVKTTARVLRTVDTPKGHEVRAFSSWAPKCLSGIGKLPDTLQDRSLPIMLQRKRSQEHVERLRIGRGDAEFYEIKQRCAGWAFQMESYVADHDPEIPKGLSNRQADNWSPLFTIADLAGGHWPGTIRRIAIEGLGEDDADARTQILMDIKAIFNKSEYKKISTSELLEKLVEDGDTLWCEWKNGKQISPRQLAGLLGPYGIKSHNVLIKGNRSKGYDRASFIEAWERYTTPSSEITGTKSHEDVISFPDKDIDMYALGTGTDGIRTVDPKSTHGKSTGTLTSTQSEADKLFANINLPKKTELSTDGREDLVEQDEEELIIY